MIAQSLRQIDKAYGEHYSILDSCHVRVAFSTSIEWSLGHRLDRFTLTLGRMKRDGHVTQETLALFVRYQLMVKAPLPDADLARRAVSKDRFATLVRRVGEALASGRRTLFKLHAFPEPGQE